MQDFYVELYGECEYVRVIKVQAENEKEAILKAKDYLIQDFSIYVYNNLQDAEAECKFYRTHIENDITYCAVDLNDGETYGEFDTYEEAEEFVDNDQGDHNLEIRRYDNGLKEWLD